MTLQHTGIEQFCQLLESLSGLHYSPDKSYLFESRLRQVVAERKLTTYLDLIREMQTLPAVRNEVMEALVTSESFFFRDEDTFRVLPRVAEEFSAGPLVVWSVGCATGQEAYSILMTLAEAGWVPRQVRLFGIDLSSRALAQARVATYTDFETRRGLPERMRERYFDATEGGWQLKAQWRAVPDWIEANLQEGVPKLLTPHLIFCRNILVYFRDETKRRIVSGMLERLHPNGYLILGNSENNLFGPDLIAPATGQASRAYYRSLASASQWGMQANTTT